MTTKVVFFFNFFSPRDPITILVMLVNWQQITAIYDFFSMYHSLSSWNQFRSLLINVWITAIWLLLVTIKFTLIIIVSFWLFFLFTKLVYLISSIYAWSKLLYLHIWFHDAFSSTTGYFYFHGAWLTQHFNFLSILRTLKSIIEFILEVFDLRFVIIGHLIYALFACFNLFHEICQDLFILFIYRIKLLFKAFKFVYFFGISLLDDVKLLSNCVFEVLILILFFHVYFRGEYYSREFLQRHEYLQNLIVFFVKLCFIFINMYLSIGWDSFVSIIDYSDHKIHHHREHAHDLCIVYRHNSLNMDKCVPVIYISCFNLLIVEIIENNEFEFSQTIVPTHGPQRPKHAEIMIIKFCIHFDFHACK